MRGEFIGVWAETSRELWEQLASEETAPDDLYCELYRELSSALKNKPTLEELANIIDTPVQAKEAFQNTKAEAFAGERALVKFFEKAHEALDDLVGDPLANSYFNLLSAFSQKFSLRYDLRRPCLQARVKSCWHFRWHSSVEVDQTLQFQLVRFGGEGRNQTESSPTASLNTLICEAILTLISQGSKHFLKLSPNYRT